MNTCKVLTIVAAITLSQGASADCGDLTKQLFNVEVGGTRTYVGNLPQGMRLSSEHNFGDSGVDMIYGKVFEREVNASVYWHEGRVYWFLAELRGTDDGDIDKTIQTLLTVAKTEFDPNPKLVPKGEYLRCKPELVARLFRSQVFAPAGRMPLLGMDVSNWKMKLRLECKQQPDRCRNLPAGYLD